MTYTGKFKIGDNVRILSKSIGDPMEMVLKRNGPYMFRSTGWVYRVKEDRFIDYVVSYTKGETGDFYKEEDLAHIDEGRAGMALGMSAFEDKLFDI